VRAREAAHRVRLHAPRVGETEVEFGWDIEPNSELYEKNGFRLSFPPELDIAAVPQALWLRLALICLHTQWALLRPCLVELPYYIGPAEREFWQRMTDTAAIQIVAYGGEARPGRAVELHDDGPALPPTKVPDTNGRVAAAFSGGKDSLIQAGLLAELTELPLLVTTTSVVTWNSDHFGAGRERVLSEVTRRLPVELVEVHSDYRTAWDNEFSRAEGCSLSVNELSDVLLYQATTLAAAAASGIGRSFQAAEADLQYNASARGEVIQHGHFVSSAVTHTALDRLLRRFGLRLGSLTYPLHTDQIQPFLWRRYPEVAELQFSCWAANGAQACSTCQQCIEITILLLGEGISPRRAGIDPARVLAEWAPRQPDLRRQNRPRLHPLRLPRDKTVRIIQATSAERVAAILADDPRVEESVESYRQLRARVLNENESPLPHPGYIAGFLDRLDDDLREPLRAIFDESFTPSNDPELAAMCRRSESLSRWIADPLISAERA
jgi:hypothetical protein